MSIILTFALYYVSTITGWRHSFLISRGGQQSVFYLQRRSQWSGSQQPKLWGQSFQSVYFIYIYIYIELKRELERERVQICIFSSNGLLLKKIYIYITYEQITWGWFKISWWMAKMFVKILKCVNQNTIILQPKLTRSQQICPSQITVSLLSIGQAVSLLTLYSERKKKIWNAFILC